MFRTGGVIQNSANGQIIAWLRENGASVGVPEPLLQVHSGATGMFGNALGIVGGVTLLNLAMSGAAVFLLEKRITNYVAQVVRQELWRDRRAKLDAAHQYLFDSYRVRSAEEKRHLLRDARRELTVAEKTIDDQISELQRGGWLSRGMSEQKAKEAYCFHLTVMNVYKMITLCYLELGDPELASEKLEEAVTKHENNVCDYVLKCGIPDTISKSLLLELKDRDGPVKRGADQPSTSRDIDSYTLSDTVNREALANVFGVLESFDRLRGMSKALTALGMVYFDWESFEAAKHDGYLTFVDIDRVSRLQKLRGLGRRAKRARNRR